ncbi:extensin family protein [Methyloceanibacter stevinii]|uniref:extensin family protein n=1 Tax=Methyloceanibacter stevinii TaxID=1774970 RepID=UPI001301921D
MARSRRRGARGASPGGNLSRDEAKSFLRTIHGDACKVFWTVLGPEANAAHRDHFHLDMRKRRYVRICQ